MFILINNIIPISCQLWDCLLNCQEKQWLQPFPPTLKWQNNHSIPPLCWFQQELAQFINWKCYHNQHFLFLWCLGRPFCMTSTLCHCTRVFLKTTSNADKLHIKQKRTKRGHRQRRENSLLGFISAWSSAPWYPRRTGSEWVTGQVA